MFVCMHGCMDAIDIIMYGWMNENTVNLTTHNEDMLIKCRGEQARAPFGCGLRGMEGILEIRVQPTAMLPASTPLQLVQHPVMDTLPTMMRSVQEKLPLY